MKIDLDESKQTIFLQATESGPMLTVISAKKENIAMMISALCKEDAEIGSAIIAGVMLYARRKNMDLCALWKEGNDVYDKKSKVNDN